MDNFLPPSVIESQVDHHVVEGSGHLFRLLQFGRKSTWKPPSFPQNLQTDIVLLQEFRLQFQIVVQHAHQRVDLPGRTLPVLTGKGIQGQIGNREARVQFDNQPRRFSAPAMTFDALKTTAPGPTAIPVHDHGHMFGHSPGIQIRQ